jgi:uncharacterized protein involved in exopolysaccharide biosynthesis
MVEILIMRALLRAGRRHPIVISAACAVTTLAGLASLLAGGR